MSNMDKWCMKWNEFDTNIREYFRIIREDPRLFDVTLVTDDGQHIQAHKIILSAGSNFFSDIFLKSNQTNMVIFLKGINSVQLENLLNFIYNGEASVEQQELKKFLETGKELQMKGFEGYVAGVGESVEEEVVRYTDEKNCINDSRGSVIEDNNRSDTLDTSSEQHYSTKVAVKESNGGKIQINTNSDLDLQILEMIEKSDGVWKCKVCGRTAIKSTHIKDHAESHIEGISHACHICNNSFSTRNSLRNHINGFHSELLSCDLCGKSGMNKMSYYKHKRSQHKTF